MWLIINLNRFIFLNTHFGSEVDLLHLRRLIKSSLDGDLLIIRNNRFELSLHVTDNCRGEGLTYAVVILAYSSCDVVLVGLGSLSAKVVFYDWILKHVFGDGRYLRFPISLGYFRWESGNCFSLILKFCSLKIIIIVIMLILNPPSSLNISSYISLKICCLMNWQLFE